MLVGDSWDTVPAYLSGDEEYQMAVTVLDARGMKCPLPTLKMTGVCRTLKPGDILEVVADCPTFETDVRNLCKVMQ